MSLLDRAVAKLSDARPKGEEAEPVSSMSWLDRAIVAMTVNGSTSLSTNAFRACVSGYAPFCGLGSSDLDRVSGIWPTTADKTETTSRDPSAKARGPSACAYLWLCMVIGGPGGLSNLTFVGTAPVVVAYMAPDNAAFANSAISAVMGFSWLLTPIFGWRFVYPCPCTYHACAAFPLAPLRKIALRAFRRHLPTTMAASPAFLSLD